MTRLLLLLGVIVLSGCGGDPATTTRGETIEYVGRTHDGTPIMRQRVEGGWLYIVAGYNRAALAFVPDAK